MYRCEKHQIAGNIGTCPRCADDHRSELNDGLVCPKCGGASGYEYKKVYRVSITESWDGTDSDHIDYTPLSIGKLVMCLDCGKKTRRIMKGN